MKNLWRLNNPFVSSSAELQAAYRQALVKHFSQTDKEAWAAIGHTVAATLRRHLKVTVTRDGIPWKTADMKDISRECTLATILQTFFGIDNVSPEQLTYIGTEIHRLTVGKKQYDSGAINPDYLPQDLSAAAGRLIDNLHELFSEAKESSPLAKTLLCTVSGTPDNFNPLNLIIPAFEAPWRATYYTLLALFQKGPTDGKDVVVLRDHNTRDEPSTAALAVAYESLRLYPPIRRVRRDGRVDIEAVQRDPRYWGPTADKFDPSRFIDDDGKIPPTRVSSIAAWMPFAVGTMKCPSAGGYSARLIVTIVGEILRQLFPLDGTPEWYVDGPEWDLAAKEGKPLRAGRDEYASVCVHCRSLNKTSSHTVSWRDGHSGR